MLRSSRILTCCWVLLAVCLGVLSVQADPRFADPTRQTILTGGGDKFAATDSVYLMGGPGSQDGQFESFGTPNWNGWSGVDALAANNHWQTSDFNCEYLGSGFPVNHAWWCGDVFPPCGGDPDEGYGNNWDDTLDWYWPAPDPGMPLTVHVQAMFNLDTDSGTDELILEYETSGGYVQIISWSGLESSTGLFEFGVYGPGDYVGAGGDMVHLRFRFYSDADTSDEDQGYCGYGGAQIDEIIVYFDEGGGPYQVGDVETAEPGDPSSWAPPSAGDFAQIWVDPGSAMPGYPHFDPENISPMVVFIDDGIVQLTGGTPGVTWTYGPGGYVVNPDGGLLPTVGGIRSEIWSPVLDWPLQPPGYEYTRARLEFDVYLHNLVDPGASGLFATWAIRASSDDGITWSSWRSHQDFLYGGPDYVRVSREVTDLLPDFPTQVQISLGVRDFQHWIWDGSDATPAPYFDNVVFKVYDSVEPMLTADILDLPQDAFPAFGSINHGDLAMNSVPVDMARNIAEYGSMMVDPGDSIVITAGATHPLGNLTGPPEMHFVVQTNPLFDLYRWALPSSGTVYADSCYGPGGQAIPDRWCFDLPDEGWLFPGDILHYFFQVEEDQGGNIVVVTLPGDLSAFVDFDATTNWPRDFTMNALPTIDYGLPGGQPPILLWKDCEYEHGERPWTLALANQGYQLGVHYDVFHTRGPGARQANGLGGKAGPGHLVDYEVIVYTSGGRPDHTLHSPDDFDSSDDIGLLDYWLQSGAKNLVLTGDNLASDMYAGSGALFMNTWAPVSVVGNDIRPLIDNQGSPLALRLPGSPVPLSLSEYGVLGEVLGYHTFDAVTPAGASTSMAEFADPAGIGGAYPYSAAIHHLNLTYMSEAIYLPYDLARVTDSGAKAGDIVTRSHLLHDFLYHFTGITPGSGENQFDPDLSSASTAAGGPVSICVVPNGSGKPLTEAHAYGGFPVDATVTAQLMDSVGNPVVGYSPEDLWLETELGGLVHRPGGAAPDGPTNEQGVVTFSGPIAAGGSSVGELLYVVGDGERIDSSPLGNYRFNSPDQDGDLDVDLMDVVAFAQDFCGVYDYKSDFYWDGIINLSDITTLALGFGAGDRTSAVVEPNKGFVHIFFDDGSGCFRDALPDTNGLVEVLLMLQVLDPTITDVLGWEMQLEITGEPVILGSSFLYGGGTNYMNDPQFMAVAGCTPSPVVDTWVELGRFSLFVSPGASHEFFVKPMNPSSIPLTDQPAFLTSALDAYKGMRPATLSESIPLAAINWPGADVPGGMVVVLPTTAPDHPWHLNGPVLDTSGTGLLQFDDQPYGTYTVDWQPHLGWRLPDPSQESICISNSYGAHVFLGTYQAIGWVSVDAGPDSLAAGWTLTGPEGVVNGSGDLLMDDMLTGGYTLEWDDYPGWRTPPDMGGSLAQLDTLRFIGQYQPSGTVVIDAEPDSLLAGWTLTAPDTVIVFNGDRVLDDMLVGDYTLGWHDVEHWVTPDSSFLHLAQSDTLTFYGLYEEKEYSTEILSITDVGNDQGRFVRLVWSAHPYDAPDDTVVVSGYGVYRRQDTWKSQGAGVKRLGPGKLAGWDALGTVSARYDSTYQFVAQTLCDSTVEAGVCWSVFMISAETPDPGLFYDSPPDSGYSIDNLVPGVPKNLLAQFTAASNHLTWSANTDPDIQHYRIYRSEIVDGTCGPLPLVASGLVAGTEWTDPVLGGSPWDYCYRVTAVDFAGNESEATTWQDTDVSGVDGPPAKLAFYPAVPNPFNPSTTLIFDLPRALNTRLSIFDISGRRVRTLHGSGVMESGRHEMVWNGRDDHDRGVAAGVYFARLEAGNWVQTRRLALVK